MRTALVFCYYTYDGEGRPLHSRRAATLEAIEREDGVPLRETGMEVELTQLDARGFLLGMPGCGDPIHRH